MNKIIAVQFGPDYQIYDNGRGIGFTVRSSDGNETHVVCSASLIESLVSGLQSTRRRAHRERIDKGIDQQTMMSVDSDTTYTVREIDILMSRDLSRGLVRFEFEDGTEQSMEFPMELLRHFASVLHEQVSRVPKRPGE